MEKQDDGGTNHNCHKDHFHILFIYNNRYSKIIDHNWYRLWKKRVTSAFPLWNIKSEQLNFTNTAVEYMHYKHKDQIMIKTFQEKVNVDHVVKTYLHDLELRYLYYNSQMTRQVEGALKDKDKIIELLTSILLDYQVREPSHFITRALPEMQSRSDDRWQSLMSIYMRQYNKFMKEYHPVAMTMAYNQFMIMTLKEFAQNYEDMYGVGSRDTLYTKHGSLDESLEWFFLYCVHALDMSVKQVVDMFYGHFDRTQKDAKKNTIMFISEPSHGKTYLLRSI